MKLLYCSFCNSVIQINGGVVKTCYCGKCQGFYIDPIKGTAAFTEISVGQPKYLWVLGLTNDFLNNKEPDYRVWRKYDNYGLQFKEKRSVIIRVRPRAGKFGKCDAIFLADWLFHKTFEKLHKNDDKILNRSRGKAATD